MKTERMARSDLDNGFSVSTVYITDHNGIGYCETMVFDQRHLGVDCLRTPSRIEAHANHAAFVAQYQGHV